MPSVVRITGYRDVQFSQLHDTHATGVIGMCSMCLLEITGNCIQLTSNCIQLL